MKKRKYGLLSVIKNYRFHSIFFRNLVLVFSMTILPLLLVLGVTHYSYGQIYESKEDAYVDEMRTMIYEDVDALFKELRDKLLFLSLDDDVKLFSLSGSIENQLYNHEEIHKIIDMFKLTSEVIDDVYIYAPSSNLILSSAGLIQYDHFDYQEMIDNWDSSGSLYQFDYARQKTFGGQRGFLNMYYSVKYGAATRGVFVLRVDMHDLRNALDYGDNIGLLILNDNQVIFDSSNQLLGESIDDIDTLNAASKKDLVLSRKIPAYGLDVVIHMDNSGLSEYMAGIRNLIFAAFAIILFLCVALAFYISIKIYDPFAHILAVLEEHSGIDENQLLQNKNEISHILNSISRTISQKKDVEDELLMRIKLLRKAQAVALQAQINPHFIDNTLETINWMTVEKLGGNNEISEMLNCFSKLIHISLESSDTFVTLGDEVEYVKKYLFIQQKRFKDQFEVVWSIPTELENCQVIKLILQPIVENAINYGVKPFDEKGLIKIKAFTEGDTLFVEVSDSGLGLPESKVEEINKSVRGNDIKESNHIGMSNVNQRIVLAFGQEYGVTLSSGIAEGTKVTMRFPYND